MHSISTPSSGSLVVDDSDGARLSPAALFAIAWDALAEVLGTAGLRFPVIGEDRDQILGILLAKDLLRL